KVSRGPGAPELRQGACLSSVREVGGVGVVRRDLLQPGNSIHTSPAFISSWGCVRALSHWRWLGAKLFSQGPMNAGK
ncbi:Urease accessory protein UreE, partial [Dissostichus eleginoides]